MPYLLAHVVLFNSAWRVCSAAKFCTWKTCWESLAIKPSSGLDAPLPIPIANTFIFIWCSLTVSCRVRVGCVDCPSVITINMLGTWGLSPAAAVKLFASTYLSAKSVLVLPEEYAILWIPDTRPALSWYLFKLNSLWGALENVTTPICVLLGPMSNDCAKRATKSFCFWKSGVPTDPDESSKKTMSAGFDPQSEIQNMSRDT